MGPTTGASDRRKDKAMAASIGIEEESGVFTGRLHPHNGYFAGDFPALPRTAPVSREAAELSAGTTDAWLLASLGFGD